MLDRVVGFEMSGLSDVLIPTVLSRLRCAELCLAETGFVCRSAQYDER